jgi:predicted permease
MSVSGIPDLTEPCMAVFEPLVSKCEDLKERGIYYFLVFQIIMLAPVALLAVARLSKPTFKLCKRAFILIKREPPVWKDYALLRNSINEIRENESSESSLSKKKKNWETISKIVILSTLVIPALTLGIIATLGKNYIQKQNCEELKNLAASSLAFGLTTLLNATFAN